MRQRWLFIRRMVVGILVLAVVLCGVSVWLIPDQRPNLRAAEAAALRTARERWEQGGVRHYQLEIIRSEFGSQCREVVEVRDERVVDVQSAACHLPNTTQSVTDFFAFIQQYTDDVKCGPNGCACDGEILPTVEYDQTLGFPRAVSLRLEPLPEPLWIQVLERLPPGLRLIVGETLVRFDPSMTRMCTLIGLVAPETQVVLTPLP
jgi:hypothetical protein